MIEREEPRALLGGAGNPDRARSRGRGVAQPPALDPAFIPITVVPCRLLRLGAHNEARWILDRFRAGHPAFLSPPKGRELRCRAPSQFRSRPASQQKCPRY